MQHSDVFLHRLRQGLMTCSICRRNSALDHVLTQQKLVNRLSFPTKLLQLGILAAETPRASPASNSHRLLLRNTLQHGHP